MIRSRQPLRNAPRLVGSLKWFLEMASGWALPRVAGPRLWQAQQRSQGQRRGVHFQESL